MHHNYFKLGIVIRLGVLHVHVDYVYIIVVYLLIRQQNSGICQLKAFANDKFIVLVKLTIPEKVKNIVEKWENAGY